MNSATATETADTIDFADMATTVRTPEEAAAHKALMSRQDHAAGLAFRGAMASGAGREVAARAAAKARHETA